MDKRNRLTLHDNFMHIRDHIALGEVNMKYTPEQLEGIKDAICKVYQEKGVGNWFHEDVIAELTAPKPEFKEGQLVYRFSRSPLAYFRYEQGWEWDSKNFRPLTLQEAGPDFVRREDVEPLIGALKKIGGYLPLTDGVSAEQELRACEDCAETALTNLPDYLRGDDG